MTRKSITILLIFLFLSLTACGNYMQQDEEIFANYDVSTEVLEVTSEQSHIRVEYPLFTLGGECCTEINQLIENSLNDYINTSYSMSSSNLTLSANYEIMHISDKRASVVIRGISNVSGSAHPINFAFSINILMESRKYAEQSDIIIIDDALAQQVVDFSKKQGSLAVGEYFEQFTAETTKKLLQQDGVFFYWTDEDIGVIVPVPHPIGDYVEFRVRGQGDGLREP